MKPLVSALIPTRHRLMRLIKTVESLYSNADDQSCIQCILKIDDDDAETDMGFPSDRFPNVVKVKSPRGKGYNDMGRFATEAAAAATGHWCFIIDDDCWIYKKPGATKGWDTLLREVPQGGGVVAQCEFYHLGFSEYDSGTCGPNGMIVPSNCWKDFGVETLSSPVDGCLHGLLIQQHRWPVYLLKGIVYRHNRDTEEQLAAQAKL